MLSAADYFYDSDGKIKGLSSTQLDVAQDMLGGGMFTSLEEYTGFLANHGAKPEQLYKAKETWDQLKTPKDGLVITGAICSKMLLAILKIKTVRKLRHGEKHKPTEKYLSANLF